MPFYSKECITKENTMNIKMLKAAVAGLVLSVSGFANAGLIFVDSWHVGDGLQWSSGTPTAYSGQETAALLFGGDASDYVISTVSNLITDINNSAWYDGMGISMGILAQDFENGDLYTSRVRSAYILDHSCRNRYADNALSCLESDTHINYAFRVTDVPEPTTLAIFALGIMGLASRRFKKQ
jgi:hypothetical protein